MGAGKGARGRERRNGAVHPDTAGCRHHHPNKKNLVGRGTAADGGPGAARAPSASSINAETEEDKARDSAAKENWVWLPPWHELASHYLRELGFLACLAQLLGATVFWISGFTALPGVVARADTGLEDGVYWSPQVVGGTGFVVSGALFVLETQRRWYAPAWGTLGWHVGLWNLVGGLGFTVGLSAWSEACCVFRTDFLLSTPPLAQLCGAFGFSSTTGLQFQAACSTFWGSWAFLIASVVQWYESLDKYPVHVGKTPKSEAPSGDM